MLQVVAVGYGLGGLHRLGQPSQLVVGVRGQHQLVGAHLVAVFGGAVERVVAVVVPFGYHALVRGPVRAHPCERFPRDGVGCQLGVHARPGVVGPSRLHGPSLLVVEERVEAGRFDCPVGGVPSAGAQPLRVGPQPAVVVEGSQSPEPGQPVEAVVVVVVHGAQADGPVGGQVLLKEEEGVPIWHTLSYTVFRVASIQVELICLQRFLL